MVEKVDCSNTLTPPYTTEYLPQHYLLVLREFQEYFHYNIDAFNLSQLSRASLQISIFQTASLLPHPPKNKSFKQKEFSYVKVRGKKTPFLTKKNNSWNVKPLQAVLAVIILNSDEVWHVNIHLWESQETSKLLHKHL